MKRLESLQNPTVKKLRNYLQKSRDRKRDHVFIVEGIRENERALKSGYVPQWIFFDEEHGNEADIMEALEGRAPIIHECTSDVFSKLVLRSGVPNWLGVYERQETTLQDLQLPESPMVMVLQAIEKPGNLGAILRSASAAGVDAVLVADSVVDIHHPQVIRNSLGGFFDVPVVESTTEEIIEFTKAKNIHLGVTTLEGSLPHYEVDLKSPIAIVMGAEDRGVTEEWIHAADFRIKIPMTGVVDSLNVSVAAAIVLFEATRQRGNS